MTEHRFSEDDRVADAETGALGTVEGITLVCGSTYSRAVIVRWDGEDKLDVRRADTLRPVEDAEDDE